ATLGIGAGVTDVGAQAPEPAARPAAADRIQVEVMPYFWLLSMDGRTQVGPNSSDVHASFIDTLRGTDLLLGFMAHVEIRRGDWRFMLDPVYTHAVVRDLAIGPASARFHADGAIIEVGGAFVLGRFDMFNAIAMRTNRVTIEGLAGARISVVSQKLSFD